MNFIKELLQITTNEDGPAVQPMSWVSAYGSDGKKILKKLGIRFLDKPTNFADVRAATNAITKQQLTAVQEAFKAEGIELPTYSQELIMKRPMSKDGDRDGCQAPAHSPKSDIFVLEYRDSKNKYLVDRSDASDHISSWVFVKP